MREQIEPLDGPVLSVSCAPLEGGGASCEVVFADGRTATCGVDVEGRGFAYFVSPAAAGSTSGASTWGYDGGVSLAL